jgi:hypothetical protein
MEILKISSHQKHAPEVLLDPNTGVISFSGQCYIDNADKFFSPIFNWVDGFLQTPQPKIKFEMRLEYFNTSSAKCLWELLIRLERYHKATGADVTVTWFFDKDDENTWELFEDFKVEVDLPFIHVDTPR